MANFNIPASRGETPRKPHPAEKGEQKDIVEKYSEPSVDENTQNIPALPNPSVGSYVVA